MTIRRSFLITSLGAIASLSLTPFARAAQGQIKAATAISRVLGDGQKLTAVALEYNTTIDAAKIDAKAFTVEARTITKAYANISAATAEAGVDGRFVILELSPDDANAPLYIMGRGPGTAPTHKQATAAVAQIAALTAKDGSAVAPAAATTDRAINLVVDDFNQAEFKDEETDDTLKYNLFIPKNYDKSKSYPLVLFMHDAGVTSPDPMMTLVQGLGPTAFANDTDQTKHEALVLAPQFSRQVVNDKSEASSDLDTTINLIKWLMTQYSIDANRLYTTGQSGGGMMSIAMMLKYPDVFAAAFLVACQWSEQIVAPLSKNKMWIPKGISKPSPVRML
jgi:predicted peptidase